METTVADTGFVVALTNRLDARHDDVRRAYLTQQRILLPQSVLVETAYLLGRDAGISTVVAFLRGLSASRFIVVELTQSDLIRVAQILEDYRDSRVDFVDASVMTIAERYQIRTVLTLDQRDFRLFRPQHCQYFDLIP